MSKKISFSEKRNLESLAKSILLPRRLTCKAVIHGRVQEENAIKKFEAKTGKTVDKCGLFIDLEHSFLAATPDGIVRGEDALLEVKCPYEGRTSKIKPGKRFPFLKDTADGPKLRTNHNYWFQVQGQLAICQREYCYFVTYTFCDVLILKIKADPQFFRSKMLPKLTEFFDSEYLPVAVDNYVSKKSNVCKCPKQS